MKPWMSTPSKDGSRGCEPQLLVSSRSPVVTFQRVDSHEISASMTGSSIPRSTHLPGYPDPLLLQAFQEAHALSRGPVHEVIAARRLRTWEQREAAPLSRPPSPPPPAPS
jgi:hypothetical protein